MSKRNKKGQRTYMVGSRGMLPHLEQGSRTHGARSSRRPHRGTTPLYAGSTHLQSGRRPCGLSYVACSQGFMNLNGESPCPVLLRLVLMILRAGSPCPVLLRLVLMIFRAGSPCPVLPRCPVPWIRAAGPCRATATLCAPCRINKKF